MRKHKTKRWLDKIYEDLDTNDCIEFFGPKNKNGYGLTYVDGKQIKAHRYILSKILGYMPSPSIFACHTCDNRACVNKKHLFSGFAQNNTDDMVAKNRQAKGEKQGSSKLSENMVRDIIDMCKAGKLTQKEIAKIFSISTKTIRNIISKRSWKHIT